jgi:heme-degrading monooxygenase HmoA
MVACISVNGRGVSFSPRLFRAQGRRLLRSVENPEEGISISLWETKQDLEKYVNSQERKNLAKDSERLYSGEYWVKHFEIRSSTI